MGLDRIIIGAFKQIYLYRIEVVFMCLFLTRPRSSLQGPKVPSEGCSPLEVLGTMAVFVCLSVKAQPKGVGWACEA